MRKNSLLIFLSAFLCLGALAGCDDSSSDKKSSPPQWSSGYPSTSTIDTNLYIQASVNKNGNVYCVVLPNGNDSPSTLQVKNGQDAAGTPLVTSRTASDSVNSDTVTMLNISGLSYSTDYDLYIVAEDDASQLQASPTMVDISIGVRDTLFVSKNGADTNTGGIEDPLPTIALALSAVSGDINKVYVSAGAYAESVTLEDGVSLYGGFSATDWTDRDIESRDNATYRTEIQGVASSNFGVAFSGSSSEQWILEGFTITTSHPDNSYGINITASATVTIRYNTIHGGSGSSESNGIYVHGADSKMIVQHNEINGGASTAASSNGIYIETAANQIVTDNTINGGTGNSSSYGITATFPLANTSLIARNDINGGSSNTSYGINLRHYIDNATIACEITGNYIDGGAGTIVYGIYCTGTTAGTGRAAAPLICNNVIEAMGTSKGIGLYLTYTEETALVYNNTITVGGTSNYSCGIYAMGTDIRLTTIDVQNNIFIGQSLNLGDMTGNDVMLYYTDPDYAIFSPVKNNVFWGFFIDSNYSTDQIAAFNALSDDIDGNMVIDPVDLALDADYNLTASSPASVTEGGLDLSGVADFPENTGGDKIDYSGTARTSPWSIGAYESN